MKKIKKWIVYFALSLLILLSTITLVIKLKANKLSLPIKVVSELVGEVGSVLVIFPHPDDEVIISGTMTMLHRNGIEVNYLCLTRGEKGAKPKGLSVEILAEERAAELKNAASILGVDKLIAGTLPDGGLFSLPDSIIDIPIKKAIESFKPTILITYDTNKGLYGHMDHILTARATLRVCHELKDSKGFEVEKVLSLTQPRKLINLYLKYSKKFNKRYYKLNDLELPEPHFAIKTFKGRKQKEELLANYEKRKIITSLIPHKKWMPDFVFHFIHDREYFYISWNNE